MLFSSNLFLFLFLPLVIIVYYLLNPKLRNLFLLAASLLFYAWGEPSFVWIMIGSILFNYLMALIIDRLPIQRLKTAFLVLTVAGNLGLLFIYKYLDFFIVNVNRFGFDLPTQNIALPLGISFFTFQAMSYVMDVYRGTAKAQIYPQNIGLYVSFFPQLVAGPIVRYQTIADQINSRQESFSDFSLGVKRFVIGFAKKVILSNNLALVADAVFNTGSQRSVVYTWLGVIAYAFQILFDFSGYSDMAIGLGKMFGFHFLENFNYPYISRSISEFWRRWHMSLGQWFRDYVYFPLGGSRVKSKQRLVFNLFVVWSLTGIWHGASWNFVIWGLMYFVLITFEKLSGYPARFRSPVCKELYRIFTMLCILVGWVFFRAESISAAIQVCKDMTGLGGNAFTDDMVISTLTQYRYFFLGAALCSTPIFRNLKEKLTQCSRWLGYLINALSVPLYMLLLLWAVSYLMIGSHNPFIYFNF